MYVIHCLANAIPYVLGDVQLTHFIKLSQSIVQFFCYIMINYLFLSDVEARPFLGIFIYFLQMKHSQEFTSSFC